MSSINFKGKNAVWNYHLSVPYQTLEKNTSLSVKGKNQDENLIIQADNLAALKSLLPKYRGQIKCIYIDPPYNTGNENWVYNDNINSPLIKEWLTKAVGSDDLVRHDKWLCMMTPRLKMLYELLRDDGIIFISIDDNEQHRLRLLMDEIFGEENFIQEWVWQRHSGGGNDSRYCAVDHEYIVGYAKRKDSIKNLRLPLSEADKEEYKFKDKHFKILGPFKTKSFRRMREDDPRPGLRYKIKAPDGSMIFDEWKWEEKNFLKGYQEDKVLIREDKKGKWVVEYKIYLNEDEENERTKVPRSLLTSVERNSDGKGQLRDLFKKEDIFNNPKPVGLIKHLLRFASEKDSIILDSFAGSGTTADAVMSLNAEEKDGHRSFILVQLPEEIGKDTSAYKAGYRHVHEITRERVKRTIELNKFNMGFSYLELGPQIDAESLLSGKLPTYRELSKYVFYLATGNSLTSEKSIEEKTYFVGKSHGESIYLIYEADRAKLRQLAITLEWADVISEKDKGKKIIYAPACFIDEEYLEKNNMHFVSIPYDLFSKK